MTDKKRGFAAMDPEKQRQIASKGGKAVHEKGTGHEFTADEARVAGKAGGIATSKNREHMRTIGRKGGEAISSDRAYMAQLGRKGGAKVGANREHMAEIGRRGWQGLGEARSAFAQRSFLQLFFENAQGDEEPAGGLQ